MANRFTDTEKWKDEWFLELEPLMKMLWIYILDTCDYAGVWKVNFRLASYSIGTALDRQSALNAFGDRVHVLTLDKWHIPKFITFQYRGKLNPKNNAHKGALKLLEYHGIETRPYLDPSYDSVTKSFDSLGSKEQEQIQDQEQDIKCISINTNTESKITPDEVVDIWNMGLGKTNGTTVGLGANKHLRHCLEAIQFLPTKEAWENLFNKASESKFLMGQNDRSWKVPLIWLVNYDNALRVLSDEFSEENAIKGLFDLIPEGA